MASRGAAGAARPAAQNVWQLWQQQRGLAGSAAAAAAWAAGLQGGVGGLGGITAPSPTRLWDVVKRDLFDKHNAQQVSDIWMEVRRLALDGAGAAL